MDLDAYFSRIGHAGGRTPSLEVLRSLHLLHPQAIPFESVEPFLGRPVPIDAGSLEAKLVRRRRGGYCFEHNGVLLAVLRTTGFQVTPLAGRVRWMLPEDAPPSPLSHMLLKVDLPEGAFLADVGFGGQSPTAPLRLEPGLEQSTPHGDYRLIGPLEGPFELQMRLKDGWAPMYRFAIEAQAPRDYEVFNWFTSTHPQSRFTGNLVAARVVGDRRFNLLNHEVAVHGPDGETERRLLADARDLRDTLARDFALDLSAEDAATAWARIAAVRNG